MLTTLAALAREYECSRLAMGRNIAYCEVAQFVGKVKYYDHAYISDWLARNRKGFVDGVESRREGRIKRKEAKNWRFVPVNVCSYDNLHFHEQRRLRNPTGNEFDGVPEARRLAIMNTFTRR